MNLKIKILISVFLAIVLAIGGFFMGYQFTEKIPLDEPIRMNFITLNVDGIHSEKCVDMITDGIVSDRLVENLMLLCTPDDLLISMNLKTPNSNTLQVEIPMEQEGNMIYFADELAWILQEECQKVSDGTVVTITDQQTVTISYEEQPNMTMAYVLAAFGAILGIMCGLIMMLFSKKESAVKRSDM